LPEISTRASSCGPLTTLYGTRRISSPTSSYRRPIKRLIEYTVFSGFVTACRLATCPTRRSPVLVIATTDGVVRAPSWLGITTGSPPCITATTELVVPRSIPIILLIKTLSLPQTCFLLPEPDVGRFARQIQLESSRSKLSTRQSIQVECVFVKFLYSEHKACIF